MNNGKLTPVWAMASVTVLALVVAYSVLLGPRIECGGVPRAECEAAVHVAVAQYARDRGSGEPGRVRLESIASWYPTDGSGTPLRALQGYVALDTGSVRASLRSTTPSFRDQAVGSKAHGWRPNEFRLLRASSR
jgi:hypothetical protein